MSIKQIIYHYDKFQDCAKICLDYGIDCQAFSWNKNDEICTLRADWLSSESGDEQKNFWSGHRCDLVSSDLPQTLRYGLIPSESVLPKPIPPTKTPTTAAPGTSHICDTKVSG